LFGTHLHAVEGERLEGRGQTGALGDLLRHAFHEVLDGLRKIDAADDNVSDIAMLKASDQSDADHVSHVTLSH
jgi:hypothetical protein